MSNMVTLDTYTTSTGHTGAILEDTYASTTTMLDEDFDNDLELLRSAATSFSDEGSEIFQYMKDNEQGIEIRGSWYDYDEVKPILDDLS